jgi:hypothetical protein
MAVNMTDENKAGNAGNTAPAEGKAENTSTANAGNGSATASDASKIAELEAKLAKSESDKEVYRSGLLAAKDLGKKAKHITQEVLEDPEKLESAIEAKIQDKELTDKAYAEAEAKVKEDERLRKENEELRRSLEAAQTAGFAGGASMGSGHNENSESKPTGYWSDAQKNELRQIYTSRGLYSQDQITKMLAKAEEIARTKTATSDRQNDMTKTRSY